MSKNASQIARRATGFTPVQKGVLNTLAWYADDDGNNSRPGVPRIAIETGLSERTVRRALASLREDEIITETESANQHRATTYKLNLEKLETMAHPDLTECHPRPDRVSSLDSPDLTENPARPDTVTGELNELYGNSNIEKAPDAPRTIEEMAMLLSEMLGIMITNGDVPAIKEMLAAGVERQDIAAAIQWRIDNGKPAVKTAKYIKGGAIHAKVQRTQKSNARPGNNRPAAPEWDQEAENKRMAAAAELQRQVREAQEKAARKK